MTPSELSKMKTLAQVTASDLQVEPRVDPLRQLLQTARSTVGQPNSLVAELSEAVQDLLDENRKLTNELHLARAIAESAACAKSQFLTNMSHEIRTPLNAILGFAELMSTEAMDRDASESLKTIQRNGRRLLAIVDEILDLSKAEANALEVEDVEIDLRALFSDVNEALSAQARIKNLEFSFDCKTELPTRLKTDPSRLKQILFNVVGNALKFTLEGRVDVEMSWAGAESGADSGADPGTGAISGAGAGQLRILVRDTGVGIDPLHAFRLFEPFTQADSSTTRKYGGTGLGLTLSRRLAVALGGDVRLLDTEKNRGSIFVIEISAHSPNPSDRWSEVPKAAVRRASTEKIAALEGLRVLVVDDAVDNRTLISRFLRAAGARVDCAIDGNDGMIHALSNDYDVVLMDIQMPLLDGYSATTRLRADGYRKPIIALTAHALKEERESSLRAGCDDHLTKPIDRSTLIDRVARFGGKLDSLVSLADATGPETVPNELTHLG